MSKHTKGPWHIVEGRTHGSLEVFSGDTAIAEIWRRGNASLEMANAQRIVACINACEGFSTEELEGANLCKDSIESDAEILALRQQRDELIAALKRWIWLRDTPAGFIGKYGKALREAVDIREAQLSEAETASRAAIAKAGGAV